MKAMSIIGALLSIVGMFHSYIVMNAGDCQYLNSSLSKNETEIMGGIMIVINIFLLVFSILVFIKSNKK